MVYRIMKNEVDLLTKLSVLTFMFYTSLLSFCAECSSTLWSSKESYWGVFASFTGEVTPGLTQIEYALRRHKLLSLVQKEAETLGSSDHAIILLSHPTYYMTNDIPFSFHQNTNFLYLCGFQEPDSILLLHTIPGMSLPSHKAVLFVPRRNESRELWDGPRSGVDGAVALTGVDEAYNMAEFRQYLQQFKGW